MRKFYFVTFTAFLLPVIFYSCMENSTGVFEKGTETLIFRKDTMLYAQGHCQSYSTTIKDSTIKAVRLEFISETDCTDTLSTVFLYVMLYSDRFYTVDRSGPECNTSFNQTFELSTENIPLNFSLQICSLSQFYIKAYNIKLYRVN